MAVLSGFLALTPSLGSCEHTMSSVGTDYICTSLAHSKAVGTFLVFGGGGAKKFLRQLFFCITLTYKKDTIFCICICVISKIHWAMSLFWPYSYTLIYMSLFLITYFFGGVGKYWGAIAPPPVPMAMHSQVNTNKYICIFPDPLLIYCNIGMAFFFWHRTPCSIR